MLFQQLLLPWQFGHLLQLELFLLLIQRLMRQQQLYQSQLIWQQPQQLLLLFPRQLHQQQL